MAKISARGATKLGTWTNERGASLVLCSDGRILHKSGAAGAGYTLHGRVGAGRPGPGVYGMLIAAGRYAARLGYSPATR